MEEVQGGKKLINGTNCYFDYDKWDLYRRKQQAEILSHPSIVQMAGVLDIKPPTKKKKKKSKGKGKAAAISTESQKSNAITATAKSGFSVKNVTLADPDAEYPESRVIRAGPNGDVVVESLDDVYPRESDGAPRTQEMVPPVARIPPVIARKVLRLDEEKQQFWDELSPQAQRQMFTISARDIEIALQTASARCYCSRCERNDVHVLGLVAEGIRDHMRALLYNLWEQFELQYYDLDPPAIPGKFLDMDTLETIRSDVRMDEQNSRRFADIVQIEHAGRAAGESSMTVRNFELFHYVENIVIPMIKRGFALDLAFGLQCSRPISTEKRQFQDDILACANQILRMIVARNDRTRMLRETKGMGVKPLSPEELKKMTLGQDLIDCLYAFMKQGKDGINKAVKFVKVLATVGSVGADDGSDVTEQMTQLAESLTGSEGSAFIEEVLKLKDMAQDSHNNKQEAGPSQPETERYGIRNPFSHCKCDFHKQLSRQFESARNKAGGKPQDSELPEHSDEDFDEEFECEHGHHYHDDDDEDDVDEFDNEEEEEEELEYSEEESEMDEDEAEYKRFNELRDFFFMEACKIILRRFEELYKKRLSEDRTKMFIEELEAEENAKKEKELKKLKQKEKQKEKKRLQQLEKEEQRKQKEAEEMEKAAAIKRKQEELRAEQKRREEEARLKKEQEKLKKIEALKEKERLQLAESKAKAESNAKTEIKAKAETNTKTETKAKVESKAKAESKPKAESKTSESKLKVETKGSKIPAPAKDKSDTQIMTNDRKKAAVKENAKQIKAQQVKPSTAASKQAEAVSKNTSIAQKASNISLGPPQEIQKEITASSELHKAENETIREDSLTPLFPPKNHLLEQLYHSRPRTVSASAGDPLDLFNEQGPASRMGTGYSPSKKSLSAYQPDSWNTGAGPSFAAESLNSPNLDRPQFLNGNANTWGARSSQDALINPAVASPLMSNLPSSTIWSSNYPSRGSSIWGSNPAPSNEQHIPNLWAAQNAQIAQIDSLKDGQNNKEHVQSAAFKAIKETEAVKDANDGMSSAMRIFQTAKSILNDNSLKMSDFLSALHSSTRYHFEIVYDDFGSVTDILANIQPERIYGAPSVAKKSPSPHQVHVPPLYHSQPFSQMDPSLNFQSFAPSQIPLSQPITQPMAQPMSQTSFQTAVSQDSFQTPNGVFRPSVPPGAPFPQATGPSSQPVQAVDNGTFQPGPFRESNQNVNQLEAKISETMQGSLNQLGIGQVRNGIW